jgi:hypothetical protein
MGRNLCVVLSAILIATMLLPTACSPAPTVPMCGSRRQRPNGVTTHPMGFREVTDKRSRLSNCQPARSLAAAEALRRYQDRIHPLKRSRKLLMPMLCIRNRRYCH